MSNPFIINVPTITSYQNPQVQVNDPPPTPLRNFSINQTALNKKTIYYQEANATNAGVSSLNNLDNAVTISSTNGNLTVAEVGNDIQLTVLAGGIGVELLNNLTGSVTVSSTNANLTVNEVGNDIQLTVPNSVSTLNNLDNAVTISSTNGNLTINEVGNDIQLTVLAGGLGVESLDNLVGNIGLTSTGNTVAITTVGQNINLETVAVPAGVSSVQTLTGAVGLTSSGGTIGITTVGQNVNLEALGITPVSNWANFPAINTVDLPNRDFNMTTSSGGLAYNKATLNANVDIGNLTNAPVRPDFNAYVGNFSIGSLVSPTLTTNIYSLGGVDITSALGVSILGGGGVSIAGGGGVSVVGAGAVTVNSVGGIVVDGGGAISINGAGGMSIVGGGVLSIASGGILVSGGGIAVNAGGITVGAGGLNITSGAVAIGAAGLAGGGLNVYGSDLSLLPVGANTATLKTNLITSASGTPTLAISNVSTINGVAYPPPNTVYQATYAKSTAQTLTSGNTDITFDLVASWSNIGSYMTHTNGTTAFTVGVTGLYQLEFNTVVLANGAVYATTVNRNVGIDLTRPSAPVPEQTIITNSAIMATGQNYGQSVASSYYLEVGDIINLRIGNSFTLGPPTVQQSLNTFDLNTFFSWRYISP